MLDAVVICNGDGMVVDVNPAVEKVLGWPREDVLGRRAADFWEMAAVNGPTRKEIYGGVLEQGSWRGECKFSRRDGLEVAAEVTVYSIPEEAAGASGHVILIRDISKEKATEEALIKSQHRLSDANRIGRIGHWEVDAASRRIRMYGELFADFGVGAEEEDAGEEDLFSSLHEGDRARVREAFEKTFAEGGRFDLTYKYHRPDDSVCYVRSIGEAFYGEDGAIAGLRGTVQDVGEQVLAEKELRENRDLYSRAAHYGQTAPWEIALPEGIVTADETLWSLLGIERHMAPRTVRECGGFLLPADVKPLAAAFARVTEGREEDFSLEFRCPDKDGKIRWMLSQGRIVDVIDGVPARIVGITRDITEQKQVEEALRASEHRVNAILQNVAESVITMNESGRILSVNQAFEDTFGYSADEISNKDVSIIMPESFRSDHASYVDKYLATGASQILGKAPRELEATDKSGRTFPIELMIGEAWIGESRVFIGSIRDVSDRKTATTALRESEARLRATMEGSMDGVYFHGAIRDDQGDVVDFEFVDINERGLEMVRYAREEMIGSRLSKMFPEAFESGLFDRLKSILETGAPLEEEIQALTGVDAQWLSHQIVPWGDGVAFAVRDISARKRAEEELRETQARLQEAHRIARLGDWQFDLATQNIKIYGSLGPAPGLGTDPAEISLERAINAIHPKDADRAREAFQQSITEGTDFESTHRVRFSEQHTVFLHLIGEAVRDDDGTITGMRGTMQDVTAERESERALERAKDKLSLAQRIAGIGNYDFEMAKNEVTGSAEFLCILGLEAEQKGGITTKEYFDLVHPDDQDRLYAEASASRKSGENFSTEYRIITREGTEKHVLGFVIPQFGDDEEFFGFMGTLQDVTALKQAEQQLRQAQKMEAVGQLTGGIAHDFNNLLAIIIGNLDLARIRARSDPQLVQMLEVGLSASERGAELTRQLLAYSRRQTLVPQPTDANEITSQMLRLGRRALGESIEVKFEPVEDAWWVDIDPAQLESALLNLAINARDAMSDGGTLTIRTQNLTIGEPPEGVPNRLPAGDYVEFEVTDTGTGMSEEIQQKVFEPFFTTKDVGQGSGLGLSMVYGFAKQSGGQVNIASTVGEGTTIYLYLPRAISETHERTEQRSEAVERGSPDETVLIVEDDPHVRDLAISLVESLGYSVMQAGDPTTALEIVESGAQVDLLLSDVILGKDMNGVELANRVREDHPSVEILLMSGNAREAFEKNGRRGDRHDLIGKPFRRADLARKIDSLLH